MSKRLSHPFLRVVLFFSLMLAGILPVATPTTALAAPATQGLGTAEATTVAYYESDVFEVDGELGYTSLTLYEDSTFELYLESMETEESLTAHGDFVDTDDGILLTITHVGDEEVDAPVELEFFYDADDSLLLPGDPDGLFGDQDVLLYWVDVEEDDVVDTSVELAVEIGGAYISPLQEDDFVIYVLNLLPSGEASLSSDYLDLTPAIFELGTWTDNGDDTVTVEITGTPDEDYTQPIVLEFAVGGYGELIISDIPLYPVSLLGSLDGAVVDSGDDEIGNAESDVLVFVAEVSPPSEAETFNVFMWLYDDGTAILTVEDDTDSSVYGEWTYEDGVLSLTILSDGTGDLNEAVSMVLELQDDDSLVGVEYPVDIFGEDGLIFYPAESSTESIDDADVDAEDVFYYYESDPMELTADEEVIISLVLSGDGYAIIGSSFQDDEEPYLEYGEWDIDADGLVVVTVSEGPDGEVYDEPYVFTFEEDPDDYSLILIEETVEVFGDFGLVLNRTE